MTGDTELSSIKNSSQCINRHDRSAPLVMVVNDTQEILALFRDILTEEGYEVVLSSYAPQEMHEILAANPDLLILDLMIGGEAQGWQLLQKLRMTRETQKIPVVVCTAAVQLAKELEGHLTKKNVGLVLKPFDIDDLLEAVSLGMMFRETDADAREPEGAAQR